MDTTQITHLSICSGYGGIDLGLRKVFGENLRTIAYAEIEAFAVELLLARMEGGQLDAAPVWPDLKSFPWAAFRDKVSILSGGYPCQPFSSAGKRLGTDDPRHLWPFIADGIRAMRPKFCFFENVEGHISLGLRAVLSELESIGYETAWGIFSAAEVGAPHQRKRVFILANAADWRGKSLHDWNAKSTDAISCRSWPSRPGEPQHEWEPPRVVANIGGTDAQGAFGTQLQAGTERPANPNGRVEGLRQVESPLGGDIDGSACGMDYAQLCVSCDNRTDELRLLGNGVVPATAHLAFITLYKELFP